MMVYGGKRREVIGRRWRSESWRGGGDWWGLGCSAKQREGQKATGVFVLRGPEAKP